MRLPFTIHDIRRFMGEQKYTRGADCQASGAVTNLTILESGLTIRADVQDGDSNIFKVLVKVGGNRQGVSFNSFCSCPFALHCEHAVASLIEAVQIVVLEALPMAIETLKPIQSVISNEQTAAIELDTRWLRMMSAEHNAHRVPFEKWSRQINAALETTPVLKKAAESEQYLLYFIRVSDWVGDPEVELSLKIAKKLKRGGFGANKVFSVDSRNHYAALRSADHRVLHKLEVQRREQDHRVEDLYRESYPLVGPEDGEILQTMIETGRCFLDREGQNIPLVAGGMQKGVLEWSFGDSGEQKLICQINGQHVILLPMTPLWYVEEKTGLCGALDLPIEPGVLKALLFSPSLKPDDIPKMTALIKDKLKRKVTLPIPLPYQFNLTEQELVVKPSPKLFLFGIKSEFFSGFRYYQDVVFPLGKLSFMYGNTEVKLSSPERTYKLDSQTKTLQTLHRQFVEESAAVHFLLQKGASIFSKKYPNSYTKMKSEDFLIGDIQDETAQQAFVDEAIPALRAAGWDIRIDKSFPVQDVIPIEDWYTEIHETPDIDWFNMELGFIVSDQKINILPFLVDQIQKNPGMFSSKYLNTDTDEYFVFSLENGQAVQIPKQRIHGILSVLTELYDDKSLDKSTHLSVSRSRANQLFALEKMMQITKLRWMGGEQLHALHNKLSNFNGINAVEVPASFLGELRDYQKLGLNWLGFLKEYQLGGILADDMGLGKTVQILAHILSETEAGHLKGPCLIVAPTSLMNNWQSEARRFTPSLCVVILQGKLRKQQLQDLKTADIILTTYPLLTHDKDILLEYEYAMIILDEAQNIKNAATQAYQILQQLKTKHRLCLTGTPMENHLGELWSLFNFLSPGLLGSLKQFSQIFRTPIEKQGDIDRRRSLNQRIHPYMLRRTKEAVVQELPSKTEIIQEILLGEAQRDLYEGIRLAMETKIKTVIAQKGLANSQIIILDALLKLRQTCCDPRLLSLEHAKKVTESAKLTFLMDMLSELVAEGRKILLFSSFTSMLKLIEEALVARDLHYVKLTGRTVDRTTPINAFQKGTIPLFLLSLKAGGAGLNLTAADTVIHYDPWWNPAAEAQATDRAYRIGQTKPVFVYKLVTTGTVEEKILVMQQKKRALLDSLFQEKKTVDMGLSKEDLAYLFQPIEVYESAK